MEDLTKTRVFSSEDMRREMIRSNLKTVINALNERGYNAVHQIAGYLISNDPASILNDVYNALKEKGYNPINQLVGYLISGDPSYITSYNGARALLRKLERDEIIEELVKSYLEKE